MLKLTVSFYSFVWFCLTRLTLSFYPFILPLFFPEDYVGHKKHVGTNTTYYILDGSNRAPSLPGLGSSRGYPYRGGYRIFQVDLESFRPSRVVPRISEYTILHWSHALLILLCYLLLSDVISISMNIVVVARGSNYWHGIIVGFTVTNCWLDFLLVFRHVAIVYNSVTHQPTKSYLLLFTCTSIYFCLILGGLIPSLSTLDILLLF